ncbi:SepM family pheromone-processing serine protease [Alteribacillus sp. HJP-4]|uniref:SepM family pheromone-processing serine protease n=1 Tax=Alteribacillus sp. HJP-4 TaxID=2775394 RepID=UPI0035CCE982
MKTTRAAGKRGWIFLIVLLLLLLINQIPLPYYYAQPGEATGLHEVINVENAIEDQGEFYLTTIRQRRANIPLYLWAQVSQYRTVTPTDSFLMEGETDEEYFHRQDMMMESSQEASKIVAYQKADKEYNVDYLGIRVSEVIQGMDAEHHLKEGDLIQELDGESLQTLEEMNELLADKEAGEEVELTLTRDGETLTETISIDNFPEEMDDSGRAGLGLLYPYTYRDITFNPEVAIEAGAIGGPSAGLMFSLEIYNQLLDEDVTRGQNIAGTGSIDEEGNVGRIGGIKQKIVAADKSGVDVFFAPDDEQASPSNYEQAMEAAEDIDTDMKVVPVKTFDDAVEFLDSKMSAVKTKN